METINDFKEKVKNDERRKKFFLEKISSELKRYNISCDDITLEKLLLEAIDSFDNNPSIFSSYAFNYVKENIDKKESKYPKNNLFSESEMIIIEQYLEKKDDGYYKTTEEIAKNLGISILDITQTVYKLKTNLKENSNQIYSIFGDLEKILNNRKKKKTSRKKIRQKLSDEDIELIGLFTGQLNDICLDIEELANNKNTSYQIMLEKIKNIYNLLDNKENYQTIIKKYPSINEMLKIRGSGLGIEISSTILTEGNEDDPISECVIFFKTLYKKDVNGNYMSYSKAYKILGYDKYSTFMARKKKFTKLLEEDKKFKEKVLEQYPTIFDDRIKYNEKPRKPNVNKEKNSNKTIESNVKFLKCLYKPQDNGKYLSPDEIANLLHIKKTSIYAKKSRLFNKINEDENFKALILKLYPELDDDIEKIENHTINKKGQTKTKEDILENNVLFLKYLFKIQDNGKYLSLDEIANLLHIKKTSISAKKSYLLKRLQEDEFFKELVLNLYPELDDDIKKRKNIHTINKRGQTKTKEDILGNNVLFLKYLFKLQDNGKYLSNKEIANLLNIAEHSIHTQKSFLLKKLNEDKSFKGLILKLYPELDDDISKKEKYNTIGNNVKFLKCLYKPQDNGKYLSPDEISKLLNITKPSIYPKKSFLLKRLQEDENFKNLILELYPELDDDISKKEKHNTIGNNINFLKCLFKANDNGEYLSNKEIANLLNITEYSIYAKKSKLLNKLNEDKSFKDSILKLYPELDDDIEKRKNKDTTNKKSKNERKINKLKNDVIFFKYLFKTQDNGEYLSNKEIANLLNITEYSIYAKKSNLLKKLNEDKVFKDSILELYPELDDDISKKEKHDKIGNNVKFLKYLFKSNDNGEYLSNKEIANLLNITEYSIYTKKSNLLKKLNEDKVFKDSILELYPELDDDINKRNNDILTEKEKELANLILTDKTRKLEKINIYAKNLDISSSYFTILRNKTLSKIKNNPIAMKSYPKFEIENEIISNYKKRNSIPISKRDLQNIKNNVKKYNNSNTKNSNKDNLLKGINSLEKSIYSDYVSLCTMEQKVILALRLGYFNDTSFSTKDVSDMFGIEEDKISSLTIECLKSGKKQLTKKSNKQKTKGTI